MALLHYHHIRLLTLMRKFALKNILRMFRAAANWSNFKLSGASMLGFQIKFLFFLLFRFASLKFNSLKKKLNRLSLLFFFQGKVDISRWNFACILCHG